MYPHRIVWINGSVPSGSFSDLKLARDAYVHMVDEGEKTIADDSYKDPQYFIYPSLRPHSAAKQKEIMSRHETINVRLKQFRVLANKFRHPRQNA
jgi:hypothetical protein